MLNNPTNFPVRVMVVDDSAVIRGLVSRWLETQSDIEVVASAANGQKAVEDYSAHGPDVVVMDVEMPVLDGIEALQKILEIDKDAKIIMSSSLTRRNANISLRALELGASDYLTKPIAKSELHDKGGFQHDLVEKVRALGQARRSIRSTRPNSSPQRMPSKVAPAAAISRQRSEINYKSQSLVSPKIIGIGSSTGGPQALFAVFKSLKSIGKVPIVITQHMPATFTTIFAEHLARASGLPCQEGQDGEILQNGHIYIAPGDYHMEVRKQGSNHTISLNQNDQVNYCRPAVDPMFFSLSHCFGPAVLGVILTGMGQDGLKGSEVVSASGGTIIAQDEDTSIVWGMPGAVSKAGLCSAVLPLEKIPSAISKIYEGGRL